MIAVISRNAAVAPPCSAGRIGLPMSFLVERHHAGQLVAAALEFDPEKPDIGHAIDQRLERGIAALLDHLHGLGTGARHHLPSTVKVPVAVATGRAASSSIARARTKATERVM